MKETPDLVELSVTNVLLFEHQRKMTYGLTRYGSKFLASF